MTSTTTHDNNDIDHNNPPPTNHDDDNRARRLIVSPETLEACGARLRHAEGLVAFPTETVYGLGGNALHADNCRAIFAAKERPWTDPLIVHVHDPTVALNELWEHPNGSDELHRTLLQHLVQEFWPGPLTLVAKANLSKVPELVTAHSGYVACRSPSHPIARALIQAAQVPIAAPSANKFGHVSPTTADHVWCDLQHEASVWILEEDDNDKDDSNQENNVGVESSVVKLELLSSDNNNNPRARLTVLRQGAVSASQLQACLARHGLGGQVQVVSKSRVLVNDDKESTVSPGQLLRHYSPHVPSFLVSHQCLVLRNKDDDTTNQDRAILQHAVVIDYGQTLSLWKEDCLTYRDLSPDGSSAEAARCIFDALRWAEAVPGALCILFPHETAKNNKDDSLALAIQDRLMRAASGTVIDSLPDAMIQLLTSSSISAAADNDSKGNNSGERHNDDDKASSLVGRQEHFYAIPPELLAMMDNTKDVIAQETLALDRYWQKWLREKLALYNDTKERDLALRRSRSAVTQWRNDDYGNWYCYWDESYGMPQDRDANFVFRPALEVTRGGALHETGAVVPPLILQEWLNALEPSRARDTYQWLQTILDLTRDKNKKQTRYIGWGDEGDGVWEPLFVPWDNVGTTLTAETLLNRLGAHPQVKSPLVSLTAIIMEESEELDDASAALLRPLQEFLDPHSETLVFYCGSEHLNPVPCFAVARVREDLVVGFVGGITHT